MSLRVGMVGCGMAAGGPVREGRPILGTHAEACRDLPGVELVAAADPDAVRREAFARHWGVGAVFAGADELLAAVRPDLLIVATPPAAHEAICLAALRQGVRGILCEKPFTGHAEPARRIVEAARVASIPVVVNFSRRWDASHQAAIEPLSSLGRIVGAWGCYVGTLRGNGSHLVDTLRMFVPDAWRLQWVSPGAGDDGPLSLVLGGEGRTAHLQCVVDPGYFVFELTLFGTDGRLRLTLGGNDFTIDRAAPSRDYPGYRYLTDCRTLPGGTMPGSFRGALAELVRAVEERRAPVIPAESFLDTLTLIDQAVAASHREQ